MQYRTLCKEKVSVLGYGCMRFPTKDDNIDFETSEKLLERAFSGGINYYDTAYPYHNRQSEDFLGKTIVKNHRKDILLATKCPVWEVNTPEDFDRIFNDQLSKLGTDYIDFYLLHALDSERWEHVLKLGLLERTLALKNEGKIRHIGFSFHDSLDSFKTIINGWDKWEFCQIQLNYINIDHQAGIAGLEYAKSKGLDVIIMEPLLGGRLANPPAEVKKTLGKSRTPVDFALSFLWNRPEVSLLLSGMGAMEQVEDNLALADKAKVGMLSRLELNILAKAKQVFDSKPFVAYTACGYCMPCPAGLDIPHIYSLYNRTAWNGKKAAKEEYDKLPVKADSCIGCGACLEHCPQHIASAAIMPDIAETFK